MVMKACLNAHYSCEHGPASPNGYRAMPGQDAGSMANPGCVQREPAYAAAITIVHAEAIKWPGNPGPPLRRQLKRRQAELEQAPAEMNPRRCSRPDSRWKGRANNAITHMQQRAGGRDKPMHLCSSRHRRPVDL